MPLEMEVLATPEAIDALMDRIMGFMQDERVDQRTAHNVALIVEELVVNLGSHGSCRDRPAKIKLSVEPGSVNGEIRDSGPAFDLTKVADPDINLPVEDRPIGGLGLFLVRKLTTSLQYSQLNGENLTSFAVTRRLGVDVKD